MPVQLVCIKSNRFELIHCTGKTSNHPNSTWHLLAFTSTSLLVAQTHPVGQVETFGGWFWTLGRMFDTLGLEYTVHGVK